MVPQPLVVMVAAAGVPVLSLALVLQLTLNSAFHPCLDLKAQVGDLLLLVVLMVAVLVVVLAVVVVQWLVAVASLATVTVVAREVVSEVIWALKTQLCL